MPGPWEKYQSVATTSPGSSAPKPWERYQTPPPATAAEESPGLLGQIGHMAIETGSQLGGYALDKAVQVGKKIDSYTGAPVRSGIGALQNDKGIKGAIDAYETQFGKDSDLAPTGTQIAEKAGLDNKKTMSERFPSLYTSEPGVTLKAKKGGFLDFTNAGAAGQAINVAADPTIALGGLFKAARAIPAVEKGVEAAKGVALSTGAKVGEALTGVPSEEIKTYVSHLKEINDKIKRYGDDIPSASDDVRAKFSADIKNTRQSLNQKISTALQNANPNTKITSQDIIQRLNDAKRNLNPKLKQDVIDQIDEMIQKVNDVAGTKGHLSVRDAFDVKNYLQDLASGSYQKAGQIFIPGKESARAAKQAAQEARKALNAVSPEIKEANNQLSLLHGVEENINKNLIAPGKPESALLGSGATAGNRNAKNLEKLGALTGTDMTLAAKKLAAQRRFTSPGLLPVDTTGKSATRVGVGAGLGFLLGHVPGMVAGSAITSPSALKGLLNAGHAVSELPAAGVYGAGMLGVRNQNKKATP